MSTEHYDLNGLRERVREGWSPRYVFFWGHTRAEHAGVGKECLSQWYPAELVVEGEAYPTAEHYMMAQKALLFGDADVARRIRACRHPGEAKELGRHVRDFDEDRWRERRFGVVVAGNRAKFGQHAELGAFLAGTGPRVLVEASPKDAVWGIGLAEQDERAKDPLAWPGLNLLGFALMVVRAGLAERHGT